MTATISVIGNICADIVARPVVAWPEPGNEVFVDSIAFRPGGGAGNAGMVLSALRANCAVYGSIGNDAIGRAVLEMLHQAGVNTTHIEAVNGFATSVTVALEAADKDRSFLTAKGHLEALSPQSINPSAFAAELVLLTGYFTTPLLRPATRDILRAVHLSRGATFFDPGSDIDGWPSDTVAEIVRILEEVDCFLPNAQELFALTGIADPMRAAQSLSRQSGGWTIAKLGSEGCIGAGPKGEAFSCAAEVLQDVDTTGAGDAFNGGLLYARSKGSNWAEAASFACHLTGKVLRKPADRRHVDIAELKADNAIGELI